jgi:hypothetical protein
MIGRFHCDHHPSVPVIEMLHRDNKQIHILEGLHEGIFPTLQCVCLSSYFCAVPAQDTQHVSSPVYCFQIWSYNHVYIYPTDLVLHICPTVFSNSPHPTGHKAPPSTLLFFLTDALGSSVWPGTSLLQLCPHRIVWCPHIRSLLSSYTYPPLFPICLILKRTLFEPHTPNIPVQACHKGHCSNGRYTCLLGHKILGSQE